MTIGSITVDLLARTGSFETDLNRSAKVAAKRAKEIDDAVSKAGERVGVSLAAAGVAAVYFGKKLIDGLDALNDYKDATGASIENLSALEDVAGRTGAGMDTVSGILTKFNSVLKEADGKNGASQALKAIGLSAEELKRLDPAEALRLTAVALTNYADDGNKARLMQELFGKSVKEAAPFLNDLATQTELVGKVTAEQTQAAEDFNKALFALQKNAVDAGRALLKDLLPAMNEIIKAFNGGGLRAGLDAFGDKVLDWGGNAQRKNIANLKSEIESLAGTVERVGRTPGEIVTVRPQDVQDLARLRVELKQAEQAYFKFNAAAGGGRGSVNPDAVDRRKSVGSLPGTAAKTSAPKDSEFQKYLENLGKQLDKTKDLTVAEMVLADIAGGRLKLAKGESAETLLIVARQVDAAKAMEEYKKLSVAAEEARAAALLKSTLEQEAQPSPQAHHSRHSGRMGPTCHPLPPLFGQQRPVRPWLLARGIARLRGGHRMRSLGSPAVTVLNGQVLAMVQLVRLGFAAPIGLNLSNINITYGGLVYAGAGVLGSVSEIEDSPGEIKGLSFQLAGVDPAYIAMALDDTAVVQGTPVQIRTALLDSNYQVVDAPLDWSGTLDTMSIEEDGETCTISVSAESSAVDLLRGTALTYSNADQQALSPGDRAFEYVVPQASSPFVWPTRDWAIRFGKR